MSVGEISPRSHSGALIGIQEMLRKTVLPVVFFQYVQSSSSWQSIFPVVDIDCNQNQHLSVEQSEATTSWALLL